MINEEQARTFAIVYRRHLLTLVDKIERDFCLGRYEQRAVMNDNNAMTELHFHIDAHIETKTPDIIAVSSNDIDTGIEKP